MDAVFIGGVNQMGKAMLDDSISYVIRVTNNESNAFLNKLRHHIRLESDLTEFEFIQLCNLCPQHYNEAITLIPSLSYYSEENVKMVINELKKVKITIK